MYCRAAIDPTVLGITPLNELPLKTKYRSFDNDPIASGNVPVILLSDKYRILKFVINPIVLGMVDVRRIPTKYNVSRYRKLPNDEGKDPSTVAALNRTSPMLMTLA